MNFTRPTSIVPEGVRLINEAKVKENLDKLNNGTLIYPGKNNVELCKYLSDWICGINYNLVKLDENKCIHLSPLLDHEEFAFWYTILMEPDWKFYLDPHYHKADLYLRSNEHYDADKAYNVSSTAIPLMDYWQCARMIVSLFVTKKQFAFCDHDVITYHNVNSEEGKDVKLLDFIIDVIYEMGCENDFKINTDFKDEDYQYYILMIRFDQLDFSKLIFREDGTMGFSLAEQYFKYEF